MNALALLSLILAAAPGVSSISGQVLDTNQKPIAGAQVFLEQGLSGPLSRTLSDADGAYKFEDVLPGFIGVFAISDSYAYDGFSINVAPDDTQNEKNITVSRAAVLSGKAVARNGGKPVSGARITRVGLPESRVGIPLSKLRAF